VSFADGGAKLKQWLEPHKQVHPPAKPGKPINANDNQDLQWLWLHSPVHNPNTLAGREVAKQPCKEETVLIHRRLASFSSYASQLAPFESFDFKRLQPASQDGFKTL
jgi:hypothetical protein